VQPEVRGYIPIPANRLVLAARAKIGLLFPFNYSETLVSNVETGLPPPGTSRADWVRDVQVTFLRGLFSGGPSSNRGYALREIGPHGVVPFYNPGQTNAEIATSCALDSPTFSDASCDLPLGGLTQWEASLELRYPISGPLLGAVFADAADVSPERVDFRLNRPHLSVGLGVRYDTPVGPIRLDIGYRLPGLQAGDAPDEGVPVETFGLPIALSFGIGEAF
jgi:outer membrane protein insertion porin family/translocation and assembly module TamA